MKVEHTKTHQIASVLYDDGFYTALVTDTKLVLVECNMHESLIYKHKNGSWGITKEGIYFHFKEAIYYKPILISENNEKIEVGDWYYRSDYAPYIYKDNDDSHGMCSCRKILALPEHFSPEILSKIVSGELKDGDRILLEVEEI